MEAKHQIGAISNEAIRRLVADYTDLIPSNMQELDTARYSTIPSRLEDRRSAGDVHLTKSELTTLVEWKLSHGTFRPSLKALVEQNTDSAVMNITTRGFVIFDTDTSKNVNSCLKEMTQLRGVGPATASLLLSVYVSANAPFFSDELFRWAFWEEGRGKGWDRPIKYTLKEYLSMFEKLREVVTRLQDVDFIDLEKAAYVLGKTATGKSTMPGVKTQKTEEPNKEEAKSAVQDIGKRKRKNDEERTDTNPSKQKLTTKTTTRMAKPISGTRSSARLRGSRT